MKKITFFNLSILLAGLISFGQDKVGIGVANPSTTLSVGASDSSATISIGHVGGFNNKGSGRLIFSEDLDFAGGVCGYQFIHNGERNTLSILAGCVPIDTLMEFSRSGYTNIKNRLLIGSIGTPSSQLHVKHNNGSPGSADGFRIENQSASENWMQFVSGTGDLRLYRNGSLRGTFEATTGAYASVSDESLKQAIQTLPAQMPNILKLRPANYQFNDQSNNAIHIGLIAQEVRNIYPELAPLIESLNEGGKRDLYGVNYAGFIPVLIAGMKEQQQQIDLLEKQVALLKTQNEAILKSINAGNYAKGN